MNGAETARLVSVVAGKDGDLLTQSLSQAQVDFLLQRTPKKEIKTRQGARGMMLSYVEHGYVTERLNVVFGFNWDFEIVDKQILEDEVVVEAKLTVRTPAGQTIIKTQFGGADIKRHSSGAKSGRPLSIADDYKAAGSDALKKCASLLGIGLDLYGRDRAEEKAMPSASDIMSRYRRAWSQLRKSEWADEQIAAQCRVIVGPELSGGRFEELPANLQAAVVEHLEEIVAMEPMKKGGG
jgi:hypothetical protein